MEDTVDWARAEASASTQARMPHASVGSFIGICFYGCRTITNRKLDLRGSLVNSSNVGPFSRMWSLFNCETTFQEKWLTHFCFGG